MNTKIYKSVHELAQSLMEAANKNNERVFKQHYEKLQNICEDNENSKKDHPVQWETLADFTDDLQEAIIIYAKALEKAKAIDSSDFISSVAYTMATLQLEVGEQSSAIQNLEIAKVSSKDIEDKELKAQIHDLHYSLVNKN